MSYYRPEHSPKENSPARKDRRKVTVKGREAPDGFIWIYGKHWDIRKQLTDMGLKYKTGDSAWLVPEEKEADVRKFIDEFSKLYKVRCRFCNASCGDSRSMSEQDKFVRVCTMCVTNHDSRRDEKVKLIESFRETNH
jgi:hypothetical protein